MGLTDFANENLVPKHSQTKTRYYVRKLVSKRGIDRPACDVASCLMRFTCPDLALRKTASNRALFITYLIIGFIFLCWVLRDLLIQLQLMLGILNRLRWAEL